MMEESNPLLNKHNTQFLRRLEDRTIVLATARSGDVFGT